MEERCTICDRKLRLRIDGSMWCPPCDAEVAAEVSRLAEGMADEALRQTLARDPR
jgi:hypothetical protein